MKYKCYKNREKLPTKGGDYWREVDFDEHLKLTEKQTTYNYLLKNYPPPGKILEAGCGLGRWVIPLAKENYNVTGIEIEEEALNTIKQNFKAENLTLIHGDIFNMPFEPDAFDIVISLGVLEHFEDPVLQQKAIYEHIRVLKKGGYFLVTVPYLSILRLLFHIPFLKIVTLIHKIKRKQHYFAEYRYNKREFKKILEKAGLKIVDFIYDELYEPDNFGLTIDYPVREIFRKKNAQYKLNSFGKLVFKIFWKIYPGLISGGIGFVCTK